MEGTINTAAAAPSCRGRISYRFWRAWYAHPLLNRAALAMIAALLIASTWAAFTPTTAHAAGITDFLADPMKFLGDLWDNLISNFWSTIIQGELELGSSFLEGMGAAQLGNAFNELFKNSNAYDMISTIHGTVVNTLAYSVLAIVFLVQTVRIANKMDGNQAVPGVKEMIFLLLFFIIGKYIIDNSQQFCEAIYNAVVYLISQVDTSGGTYTNIDLKSSLDWTTGQPMYDDYGNYIGDANLQPIQEGLKGFAGVLVGFGYIIACAVMAVVTYVVIFSRAIQIYLYTIVAPIPLALLMCDETRQQAMGFIKNFLAVCFAGLIIVVLLKLFPSVVSSCLQHSGAGVDGIVPSIAVMFIFIFAMAKSGSWARDIFGG